MPINLARENARNVSSGVISGICARRVCGCAARPPCKRMDHPSIRWKWQTPIRLVSSTDIATPVPGVVRERWGPRAFAVSWPEDINTICSKPNSSPSSAIGSEVPGPNTMPLAVPLGPADRARVQSTFDQMGEFDRSLRGITRSQSILLQIRCFSGEQDRAHGDGTSRLRSVQRSGQMHKLSRG